MAEIRSTASSFLTFSLFIGCKYIVRFLKYPFFKEGLKRLLTPLDIARCFELPNTFNELQFSSSKFYTVLDLSSPKLLSFYIASRTNSKIIATDIFTKEVTAWKGLWDIIDRKKTFISSRNLLLQVLDGKNIPYKDEVFDKIISVSVLEHIEGDGDISTIKELSRVLKKGGVLVLTLPYSHRYYEEYRSKDAYRLSKSQKDKYFWSRYYNDDALVKRLIEPSGLKLIRKQYVIEKPISFCKMAEKLSPYSYIFFPLFPLIAKIGMRIKEHPSPLDHKRISIVSLTLVRG